MNTRGKPSRDKTPPTHLQNFFRFPFESGDVILTPAIPRVAVVLESKTRPGLPAGLFE
jgi:hypothetical protein